MPNYDLVRRYSIAATLALCPVILQCRSSAPDASAQVLSQPDQTYSVRGKVMQLPADNTGSIEVQHEAIPTFLNESKAQVGMVAMIMPFKLAPEISLAHFKPGDLVAFTLEVRWTAEPQLRIRDMSLLPADTRLKLDR
jgi:Cu/Ag efflux protein CusF